MTRIYTQEDIQLALSDKLNHEITCNALVLRNCFGMAYKKNIEGLSEEEIKDLQCHDKVNCIDGEIEGEALFIL